MFMAKKWTLAAALAVTVAASVPAGAQADSASCSASALVSGQTSGPSCTIYPPDGYLLLDRSQVQVSALTPLGLPIGGLGLVKGTVTEFGDSSATGAYTSVSATCGPAISSCVARTSGGLGLFRNDNPPDKFKVVCSSGRSLAIGYVSVSCSADIF